MTDRDRQLIADKLFKVKVMRKGFSQPIHYLVIANSEKEATARVYEKRAWAGERSDCTIAPFFQFSQDKLDGLTYLL